MNRVLMVWVIASGLAWAEEKAVWPVPPRENPIQGEYGVGEKASGRNFVLVQPEDQIYPHLAMGDGWETVVVIVNMSNRRMDFSLDFFSPTGRPMQVTFREIPSMRLVTTSAAQGFLCPGCSFNFSLFDMGQDLQVGWAMLAYDARGGRLGGYAVFRQKVTGRPTFEALVPLSAYDDVKFYLPFDNIEGFVTAMALVNPAGNLPNNVTLTFLNTSGELITRERITLPPGGHTAFVIPDRFRGVAGRLGTIYVESDITRLSALGLRFNTAAMGGFSSIPIMNWVGMFQ